VSYSNYVNMIYNYYIYGAMYQITYSVVIKIK
jgi:hypothetical protein